ncbi:unnamed protein product [Amoebophrya sp. A25]|nr:unnamed protein product [Amoebophrya sp. A25]|eukprot:GSA25T00008538001.1
MEILEGASPRLKDSMDFMGPFIESLAPADWVIKKAFHLAGERLRTTSADFALAVLDKVMVEASRLNILKEVVASSAGAFKGSREAILRAIHKFQSGPIRLEVARLLIPDSETEVDQDLMINVIRSMKSDREKLDMLEGAPAAALRNNADFMLQVIECLEITLEQDEDESDHGQRRETAEKLFKAVPQELLRKDPRVMEKLMQKVPQIENYLPDVF